MELAVELLVEIGGSNTPIIRMAKLGKQMKGQTRSLHRRQLTWGRDPEGKLEGDKTPYSQ
jgi:hypothetical protein